LFCMVKESMVVWWLVGIHAASETLVKKDEKPQNSHTEQFSTTKDPTRSYIEGRCDHHDTQKRSMCLVVHIMVVGTLMSEWHYSYPHHLVAFHS
jgi:hypothetical protein